MSDMTTLMMASSAALAGIGITSVASLRAWSGWLDLKRLELETNWLQGRGSRAGGGPIELVELKERIRKLEAIASGIEI
jgi:hypothetical protein